MSDIGTSRICEKCVHPESIHTAIGPRGMGGCRGKPGCSCASFKPLQIKPLNARDYAKSLNLLCAIYDWARHLNRGHSQVCDCNLCKTLRATDNFLNHREG